MKYKKEPLVNFIIVTYNHFDLIDECIKSILESKHSNIRLYFVDNNSDIGKYKKFKDKYKKLTRSYFFRLRKNIGFGGGCNFALRKVKSGYVVFLNDDVVVSPNWLKPIVKYMEANPKVGACQPKIRSLRDRRRFEYAGAAGGFMDVYGYPFTRGRIFFDVERDKGQYDNIVDLVWCSGSCFVTKMEVLKKVGFFDEKFFMYGEEADLCWRMNHHGYRLTFIPNSVVYHYGSASMNLVKNAVFRKTYYHHRNGLILLLKNYSYFELIRYLPFRIFLDYLAVFYYLKKLILPNALAVFAAHMSVAKNLFPILRGGRSVFGIKDDRSIVYPLYERSIVIDYFLRSKKLFKSLRKSDFKDF